MLGTRERGKFTRLEGSVTGVVVVDVHMKMIE